MASAQELTTILKKNLYDKAYKAFIGTFPKEYITQQQIDTAKKFASDFSEYADEEITLLRQIMVETIAIEFDLHQFRGIRNSSDNYARGYEKSLRYQQTKSVNRNTSAKDDTAADSGKIIGKLDLIIANK